MNKRILIPFLSLIFLLTVSAQTSNYKQAKNFDISELLNVKWYDLFYANDVVAELSVCTRWLFTPRDDGSIIYQFGFFSLTLDGEFQSSTTVLAQDHHGGPLKMVDAPKGNYLYVFDYDKDYDWIIVADTYTFGGFMTLLSKTPQNLDAIARAVKVAGKYGKTSHHLGLQTTKCSYNNIFDLLRKARKQI